MSSRKPAAPATVERGDSLLLQPWSPCILYVCTVIGRGAFALRMVTLERSHGLWAVLDGTVVVTPVGGATCTLRGDATFLTRPGWRVDIGARTRCRWVAFDVLWRAREYLPGKPSLRPVGDPPPEPPLDALLGALPPTLPFAAARAQPVADLVADLHATWWRSPAQHLAANARLGSFLSTLTVDDASDDRIAALLRERLSYRITIAQAARLLGLGERALATAVERRHGCTPGELLERQRDAVVCAALRSGATLAAAATAAGLADASVLARWFRRRHGPQPRRLAGCAGACDAGTSTANGTAAAPVRAGMRTILLCCLAFVVHASEPDIRTPAPGPQPRLTGAPVFGVRPGHPLLHRLTAIGARPITFAATPLPAGVTLDAATGQLSGRIAAPGEHVITVAATSAHGRAERRFRLVASERLALTPPMGWNAWNSWGASIDQEKVRASAQALSDSPLAQHGWSYINIDDGWQGARSATPPHALLPDPKRFPDLPALSAQVHALGLKLGIYSSPWMTTYAGRRGGSAANIDGTGGSGKRIGAHRFEAADAAQWAAWGVDYLKYDWNPMDPEHTERMATALRASGRDIVFSISNHGPLRWAGAYQQHVQLVRTTQDIRDAWSMPGRKWDIGVHDILLRHPAWREFQRPGFWPDPDMLVVGRVGWGPKLRPSRLTTAEQYSHLSLWCLWSAPLLIGCPLDQLDPFTLNLLTNDEVLALNQDALGAMARTVRIDDRAAVLLKPLVDDAFAVGLFNPTDAPATVTATWAELGLDGAWTMRDLWRQRDLPVAERAITAEIPAHDVLLLRLTRR